MALKFQCARKDQTSRGGGRRDPRVWTVQRRYPAMLPQVIHGPQLRLLPRLVERDSDARPQLRDINDGSAGPRRKDLRGEIQLLRRSSVPPGAHSVVWKLFTNHRTAVLSSCI